MKWFTRDVLNAIRNESRLEAYAKSLMKSATRFIFVVSDLCSSSRLHLPLPFPIPDQDLIGVPIRDGRNCCGAHSMAIVCVPFGSGSQVGATFIGCRCWCCCHLFGSCRLFLRLLGNALHALQPHIGTLLVILQHHFFESCRSEIAFARLACIGFKIPRVEPLCSAGLAH